MTSRAHPVIYEVNTWAWLHDLSARYGRRITLDSVPPEAWDGVCLPGIDAVWLMGVWERSPAGRAIALADAALMAEFRRVLPDFSPDDVIGSAYCIRDYVVDARLGGTDGLASARAALAARDVRLILDFVPNHVAPDHDWTVAQPAYLVSGTADEAAATPRAALMVNGNLYACGRDPYFPAWSDVAQLNAFNPALRAAMRETLLRIAAQCDGVRCDMAMLMLNDVFARTWGARAGERPAGEYWMEIIPAVKAAYPDFAFMAEAYWDLEYALQQQGFDFCYDKRLYDRMERENAETVRGHLLADLDYQRKLTRFIENHDEPRAAAAFLPEQARAAAVLVATLPGATLLHEGQFEGWRVKLPVFLRRRPHEPADRALQTFYHALLALLAETGLRGGTWQRLDATGWADNTSSHHLLAWAWRTENGRALVVVNWSGEQAQGRIPLAWDDLRGRAWALHDSLNAATYTREGDEMVDSGLYVDLAGWGYHLLAF